MAETVEYNLNLDLTLHPIQSILIKQYSKNVYKLIVSVTKETVVYVLNDSLYNVYFKMRTPDNRYVYTQGSIDENGRILLDVPESAAWTAGIGEAEFEIIKKDKSSRMSTCTFEVVIDASSYEEAEITGSEDFSALVDYISQAADISDEVAQAKEYRDEAATSATTASQAAQTATTAESFVRGLQESAMASATTAVESKESAEASATTASQAAQSASEDAEATSQALQEAIALYNGPLTAGTAAEMTQTNRIYVYTGSESGYTFGNWYYYDGSAWQSGGIYNATAMDLDNTLTVEGKAADAKAVGDAIATETATREADIDALKADLGDITETVYSSNIFDQANFTVTEGKYLNPSNGNEGTNASYCYTNEYIPIEPNTQYIGSSWSKSDYSRVGYYAEITCYYNSNKEFISGTTVPSANYGVFTTPENAYYMRFSCGLNPWNNRWYMIEKGNTNPTSYVPYAETKKLKLPIHVVDSNGNGEYTSIASAVNDLDDGSAILVMPGIYEENVRAWSKEIHIIGFDREACILKDVSGNYISPPIEIGAGSIQNMSIIEQAEGAGTANMGAYAVHVESNNLYNKKLLIRNCYIYSDSSSAIGMGLRGGCSVRIEDCEIVCAGARESTGAAPLYFHDADAQAYWGTANLYLHNNVLRNTASTLFSMLTINSIHKENTTYMHMMYNIFVRSKTPSIPQKYNTWNTSGNTDADGWNGLSHMYLEDDSFGNNQSELNYSA